MSRWENAIIFPMMTQPTYCPFELETSWYKALEEELAKPYLLSLSAFVEKERQAAIPVYPPHELVFNAFYKTPYDKVKVVILGQDPYHGPGQAHGLCFSVPKGIQLPPSLQNIYKELIADVGIPQPTHGCLISWAEQGVLLLNTTLTVRQAEPLSHHGKGWELFTDAAIAALYQRKDPIIFVLWGKNAQQKCKETLKGIQHSHHKILTTSHPSPLSAYNGFMGCKHFSKINEILREWGNNPIDWSIPS